MLRTILVPLLRFNIWHSAYRLYRTGILLPCAPNANKQPSPDLLVHVVPDCIRHLQSDSNRKPDLVIRVQTSARGVTALDPYRQGPPPLRTPAPVRVREPYAATKLFPA